MATTYSWRDAEAPLPPADGFSIAADTDPVVLMASELVADGIPTGRYLFGLWPYDDAPYGFVDAATDVAKWHTFGLKAETNDDFDTARSEARAALIASYEATS
jgi:hypothetical protein